MRCYIANDEHTGFEDVLIPGCWEQAIYGGNRCSCYTFKNPMANKKIKTEKEYIEELEKECSWLKTRLEEAERKNHKLNRTILEVQRAGLPLMHRRHMEKDPAYLVTMLRKYHENKTKTQL